jgi:uncharacterized iron-regulated protein
MGRAKEPAILQLIVALAALVAGCAQLPAQPIEGRIWDVRERKFVSERELFVRAARARHLILGEVHDNPGHHRLQLEVLRALAGQRRVLAMEQFDSEHQSAMDQAAARDAEALADAGRFDREGWNWPLYRPLVEFALQQRWPVRAANLSRAEARRIVGDPSVSGLPPAAPGLVAALERDIAGGHCGQRPEAKRLAGMVAAQRARDARLAATLTESSVLITGNGHARRDRGVPLYLGGAEEVVSVGLIEAEPGRSAPREYLRDFYSEASFDFVWFTGRHQRADPCAKR